MDKKLLIIIIAIIGAILASLYGYNKFVEQKEIGNLQKKYSHIIGTKLKINNLTDSIVAYKPHNDQCNTILLAVTASCEKCYTKLNQLNDLVQNNVNYQDVNVLIVIYGSYGDEKIIRLLDRYRFNYVVDDNAEVLKYNLYFSVNQVYVIDNSGKVLILGDLFSDRKVMRRIFSKHLKP